MKNILDKTVFEKFIKNISASLNNATVYDNAFIRCYANILVKSRLSTDYDHLNIIQNILSSSHLCEDKNPDSRKAANSNINKDTNLSSHNSSTATPITNCTDGSNDSNLNTNVNGVFDQNETSNSDKNQKSISDKIDTPIQNDINNVMRLKVSIQILVPFELLFLTNLSILLQL
ncbi:LOW QUALITY PROTEIN: hypothetical protein HZS_1436 [Henneguya salminicola]|nr:LOW QUALITY PROTEIN: hypothetical protein HZS_1436 [Henneguya salminicola]